MKMTEPTVFLLIVKMLTVQMLQRWLRLRFAWQFFLLFQRLPLRLQFPVVFVR
jgi:hypothetical protein